MKFDETLSEQLSCMGFIIQGLAALKATVGEERNMGYEDTLAILIEEDCSLRKIQEILRRHSSQMAR